jgi:hypothetical protein
LYWPNKLKPVIYELQKRKNEKMKKLFTLLLMGSMSAANLLQAQVLPNFGFDSWKGKGNCGITYLTATTASTNKTDRETNLPVGAEATSIKS